MLELIKYIQQGHETSTLMQLNKYTQLHAIWEPPWESKMQHNTTVLNRMEKENKILNSNYRPVRSFLSFPRWWGCSKYLSTKKWKLE